MTVVSKDVAKMAKVSKSQLDKLLKEVSRDDLKHVYADSEATPVLKLQVFIHTWNTRTSTAEEMAEVLDLTIGQVNSIAANSIRKPFAEARDAIKAELKGLTDKDDAEELDVDGEKMTVADLRAKLTAARDAAEKARVNVLRHRKKQAKKPETLGERLFALDEAIKMFT